MPLKIILLLLTEMVSLRGVNKVQAMPTKSFWYLFNKQPRHFHRGVPPLGGVAK